MALVKLEDTTKKVSTALQTALKNTVTPTVSNANLVVPTTNKVATPTVSTANLIKPTVNAVPIYQPTPVTTISTPKVVAPVQQTPTTIYQPTPTTQITTQNIVKEPAKPASTPLSLFVNANAKETTPQLPTATMGDFQQYEKATTPYTSFPVTKKEEEKVVQPPIDDSKIDTSGDVAKLNAELQSLLEQYNIQKRQLEQTYGLNSEEYALQLKQLTDDYNLAKTQLDQQLAEQQGVTTKEAQQAYISKMQSQRVAKNILASQGLGSTGYEWLTGRKREEAYQGTYNTIMQNYQNALNAIERSRASQQQAYSQNVENVQMGQKQQALSYQQNLENIAYSQAKAQADYQAGLKSIQQNAIDKQNTYNDNRVALFQNVSTGLAGGATMTDVKSALDSALNNDQITKTTYNDIYRYAQSLAPSKTGR